jgi:hypothetical protein
MESRLPPGGAEGAWRLIIKPTIYMQGPWSDRVDHQRTLAGWGGSAASKDYERSSDT